MTTSDLSSITTYFRVSDGVRVRFADNKADVRPQRAAVVAVAREPVGLPPHLGPRRGLGRVVAIDLPGFGHSDGRPELIAPDSAERSSPA